MRSINFREELLKLDGYIEKELDVYLKHIEECSTQPNELYGEWHHIVDQSIENYTL